MHPLTLSFTAVLLAYLTGCALYAHQWVGIRNRRQ